MADFVQGLDLSKLVLFGTVLSVVIAPFSSPPYNLPIFLFGTLVQEVPDAPQSLRSFVALLGGSVVLDIIWLAKNSQGAFTRTITIILLIFKVPTFFAFANNFRQAGSSFGGLNIGGRDLGGATVWSMPGASPLQLADTKPLTNQQHLKTFLDPPPLRLHPHPPNPSRSLAHTSRWYESGMCNNILYASPMWFS